MNGVDGCLRSLLSGDLGAPFPVDPFFLFPVRGQQAMPLCRGDRITQANLRTMQFCMICSDGYFHTEAKAVACLGGTSSPGACLINNDDSQLSSLARAVTKLVDRSHTPWVDRMTPPGWTE